MKMGAVKTRNVDSTVADAVNTAFSEIESIKEELQSWYDNLPENFQNGDKGSALQTAIDALEAYSEPDVPEYIANNSTSYTEFHGKIGRPKRRDTCACALDAAISAANEAVDYLNELSYNDDGKLLLDGEPVDEGYTGMDPADEADRDTLISELEQFASECEDAKNEWENVEFPGMFG